MKEDGHGEDNMKEKKNYADSNAMGPCCDIHSA